jgi:hypothetical protein
MWQANTRPTSASDFFCSKFPLKFIFLSFTSSYKISNEKAFSGSLKNRRKFVKFQIFCHFFSKIRGTSEALKFLKSLIELKVFLTSVLQLLTAGQIHFCVSQLGIQPSGHINSTVFGATVCK